MTTLPNLTVPTTLQQLFDRAAVIDVVNRMGIAADAQDWVSVRGCFADRVTADYSSLTDQPAAEIDADALVDTWRNHLPGFDHTQHVITGHQVTQDGDQAQCLSHFKAQHRISDRAWDLDGDYSHRLARTADGWKIVCLQMIWTFERGDRALAEEAARRVEKAT